MELADLKQEKNAVELTEMLMAREVRVERQNVLLQSDGALICFTLNIAGAYKNSPAIEKAFNTGIEKINQLLQWNDIKVSHFEKYSEKTGCEAYFVVETKPEKVKAITIQIEDSFPLGRLYDIDVIKPNGEKVSRTEIGENPRSCIICGKEGSGCARSREHTPEQLQQKTMDIICNYYNGEYADFVAQAGVKALLYEVSVTPKPGLVDRKDNGAHSDMDFFTFINSSCSLHNYFFSCAQKGIEHGDKSPEYVFGKIRYLGRLAEAQMYKATGNVNTHKGAIFSLGIISGAAGYIWGNNLEQNSDKIFEICAQMAKLSIQDFQNIKNPKTFGETLYNKMQLTGIRGQAAAGYPAVREIAYPIFKQEVESGTDFNTAGTIALANLLAAVQDTNIIKRSNIQTLENVQEKVKELLLNNKADFLLEMDELNKEFVKLNISPGGCADLLAITFMIYFLSC